MTIQPGQIVKNLIPTEPVIINSVKDFRTRYSISYTGVNSRRENSKMLFPHEFAALEVLTEEGKFNFSGDPVKFALFAEAERINSAYQFDPLFAVNCSIVDPLPHQVEAVYKFLLPLPKIRFLLADDTGAGKTIMTGLLIKELIMRGLIERILIVTPGGLTKQWQEDEMMIKFNLPFTLVNRSAFTSDPNVFNHAARIVTSIDFISREDVLNVASNSHWDLIVFDESHKLSAYDYGTKQYLSQRYKAAQTLAKQCEHLLLLTATPHRGRQDTFRMLLQLLDEDIFATDELTTTRVKGLEKNGVNRFFIRRLKEVMRDWQGQPLFKQRFTRTVAYELTPEENELYEAVTDYLTKKKEEASEAKNIHVSLALTVMQRRLASSIFAIKNTLERRYKALQDLVEEVKKNPNLWQQRHKLERLDANNIEEYEELGDEEKESLEKILADPRKYKLFTTAENPAELQAEAEEVKKLVELAQNLYNHKQEEKKFQKLQELLRNEGTLERGEKLVIFTEHRDTLIYLEERLTQSGGYKVVTIHGGKLVDERRKAQGEFAKPETQILIATDAAGEGINLQFCRLLINWDIPWNPNRLEQRMGRIHRYGQKQDVLVFNLVASNTKEGKVLEKLLCKLDTIRDNMGDDRVYDVIQDVLEGVSLDRVMQGIFDGNTDFDRFLAQDDATLQQTFKEKIAAQQTGLGHSQVDYAQARLLKEDSDEKRLQPIYIRLFFEKAFKQLGGQFKEVKPSIFRIDKMPDLVSAELQATYQIHFDAIKSMQFCFDKQAFLNYQLGGDLGKIYYINPGNLLFDSLVAVVRDQYREDMLKGTMLVSPDDKEAYLAFFVKSQIMDNRPSKKGESVIDERLAIVYQTQAGEFGLTSAAKFIDLHAPIEFAKPLEPPAVVSHDEVLAWSFEHITDPQFQDAEIHVKQDVDNRREYLEMAFTQVIAELQVEIEALQGKLLLGGDSKANDQIIKKAERVNQLIQKKANRLDNLAQMMTISPKEPEILGCAYVVPLTQVEYLGHYGMSRDDEVEAIAMQTAMEFERADGWQPQDVSANNEGYDIRSINPEALKRYVEVKGRSGADGSVMLSENEMNRLAQLGEAAWLYIVMNCKSDPELYCLQNPAKNFHFQCKSKGVQYFLPMTAWKK